MNRAHRDKLASWDSIAIILSKLIRESGKQTEIKQQTSSQINNYSFWRVYFFDLGKVLSIIGITIQDLYAKDGVVCNKPDALSRIETQYPCLTDEDLIQFAALVEQGAFSLNWWKDLELPMDRLTMARRRRSNRVSDFGDSEIAKLLQKNQVPSGRKAVILRTLPLVSETIDISLRWLLCSDPDVPLWTDRPALETAYDAYSLLMPERRNMADAWLQARNDRRMRNV